jgi:hypothetical protein
MMNGSNRAEAWSNANFYGYGAEGAMAAGRVSNMNAGLPDWQQRRERPWRHFGQYCWQ